ncbi:MAG: adenylate/guanylate cyclase domain-containing protein [Alphaproteobacteria bacterium]|nr:adenylate/guanylate cyclase domain-containing protein [Alphaproteobacteria bacterium]
MSLRWREVTAAALIALAAAIVFALPAFRVLEGLSIDALFWLRDRVWEPDRRAEDSRAVVLAIDEETYRRPPFADTPQTMWTPELGRVLGALLDAGVKVVGFDVVYPTSVEPFIRGFERDFLLALRRGAREGRVVLGRVQHQEKPIAPFAGYAIAVGRDPNIRALNVFEDDDGIVRRVPLTFQVGESEPQSENSLAVELAVRAQGLPPGTLPEVEAGGRAVVGGYALPRDRSQTLLVNFAGGAGDIPAYSLADIQACLAAGNTDYLARHFKDRVVLVGVTLDVEDRKLTSKRWITRPEGLGLPERCVHPVMPGLYRTDFRRDSIPGVFIHATAVNNLLRRDALAPTAPWASFGLSLAFALGVAAATIGLRSLAATAAVALGAVVWVGIATVAFRLGQVMPLGQVLATGLSAFPLLMTYRVLVTDRDRRQLSRAFSLYLPKAEIDRMLAGGAQPTLGGEERSVSILFSDIAGFSAISEKQEPKRLVENLNQYFAAMTAIVEAHGGFVDKFIGDAVVAVFGAPIADEKHVENAVKAAMEMRRLVNDEAARFSLGEGQPLRARIGVNSGIALVGNIGSPRRFNYTVMGDTVNLAARLEGANKKYGTQILVSDETAVAAGGSVLFREVDTVRVVGRRTPVTVFEPLATQEAATEEDRKKVDCYAAAFGHWRAGRFAEAGAAFHALASDRIAASLAEQARNLAANPPKFWDGVTDLHEK